MGNVNALFELNEPKMLTHLKFVKDTPNVWQSTIYYVKKFLDKKHKLDEVIDELSCTVNTDSSDKESNYMESDSDTSE